MQNDIEPDIVSFNIGQYLKQKRKSLNLDIPSCAISTKLSKKVITLIENNQFSDIGNQVYVRGYIGIYAKHLGEDINKIINIYDSQEPAPKLSIKPISNNKKKKLARHSKVLSGIISSLFFITALYGYSKIESIIFTKENDTKIEQVTDKNPIQNNTNKSLNEPNTEHIIDEGLDNNEQITLESIDDTVDDEIVTENTNEDGIKVEVEDADKEFIKKQIIIKFNDDCWLRITDANGETIVSKEYSAKKILKISGLAPFIIRTGKPEAIKTITIDKQEINLSQSKTGNITYTIDNE